MLKTLMGGLLCLAAPFLAFGGGGSPGCPVGADPLTILNNTTWAFTIHTPSGGIAAIGTFKATFAGGQATVNGIQTVNNNGQLSVRESFSGRYTIDPGCRGGEILINVGRNSAQLQFYFANTNTEMEFVNDGNDYYLSTLTQGARILFGRLTGIVFTGHAKKNPPAACSVVLATPLSTLESTSWTFRTYNFGFPLAVVTPVLSFGDTATAGIFDATVQFNGANAANAIGLLSVIETINKEATIFQSGSIDRNLTLPGRYTVNPDCSGGTLSFMTARQPVVYHFVFSEPDSTGMYLLSDSTDLLTGIAKQ